MVVLLLASASFTANARAAAAALPSGFSELTIESGLVEPTSFAFAPAGELFVGEKRGIIKQFDSIDDTTATVLADLRPQVHNFLDRGLLSLVVDPAYPARPYLYVLYSLDAPIGVDPPVYGGTTDSDPCPPESAGGCVASTRVSRLHVDGATVIDEHVLVNETCTQLGQHDGGGIAFGADGALYVSLGEGADTGTDYGQRGTPPNPCGDPPVRAGQPQTAPGAEGGALRAQDLQTSADPAGLDGVVIRVDPDTGAAFDGNPRLGSADLNEQRIVSYGHRNPFRLAVQPGTNRVFVAEVGESRFEEINYLDNPMGAPPNFGWPCYEGPARSPGWDAADVSMCEHLYANPSEVRAPFFSYARGQPVVSGEQCTNAGFAASAITGLAFRGAGGYPSRYDGAMFFTDMYRQCIWMMPRGVDGLPNVGAREVFMAGANSPVDLHTGPGGDLYYISIGSGSLRRIHFDASNQPPSAVIAADPTSGPAPLTVALDGTGSSDTDPGDQMTFAWDLDDDGQYDDANTAQTSASFTEDGPHTVRLRVTDSHGASRTDAVVITVGAAPTATIDTPLETTQWAVGDEIAFSGHATDPLDGVLPASTLHWSVLLHHCYTPTDCHVHHVEDINGTADGSYVAPNHEWPARIELRLTATNSRGVTDARSVILDPRTVQLSFVSQPVGLDLGVSGTPDSAPFTRTAIVGASTSVSASSPQTTGNANYVFNDWSDGGAATHDIIVPSTSTTYTVTFAAQGRPPIANAGPDRSVASDAAFALDGSASTDPDGGPLEYQWTQIGGPPVVIDDDKLSRAQVRGIRGPATLTFELTVTDRKGLTHSDVVIVTVRAPK